MVYKVIVFLGLFACMCNCGIISPVIYQAAPTIVKHVEIQKAAEPADTPAEYQFSYQINDAETGDVKTQDENRKGDDVSGSYSVIDPDGFKRTVTYKASEAGGFEADVQRVQVNTPAPTIIKKIIAAPAIVAAPTVHKVISAAPAAIVRSSFSSPLIKYDW